MCLTQGDDAVLRRFWDQAPSGFDRYVGGVFAQAMNPGASPSGFGRHIMYLALNKVRARLRRAFRTKPVGGFTFVLSSAENTFTAILLDFQTPWKIVRRLCLFLEANR